MLPMQLPYPKVVTDELKRLTVDPERAVIYEEGWSGGSTSGAYALKQKPFREQDPMVRYQRDRPEWRQHPTGFHGEGLLAIQEHQDGPVHIFGADPTLSASRPGSSYVPVVQAHVRGDTVLVKAEPGIEYSTDAGPGGLQGALGRWAASYRDALDVTAPDAPAPVVWSSRLENPDEVTEKYVCDNLERITQRDLPFDVLQIYGYQAESGDWTKTGPGFRSMGDQTIADLATRIRTAGMQAGIWIAPFHVTKDSALGRAHHHDWMLPVMDQSHGAPRYILDVTNPKAAAYLKEVLQTMRGWGITYFEADHLYAGAIESSERHERMNGVQAYDIGMQLMREAIGDDAYLVGRGAPIFPSVEYMDAMQVSPDATYDKNASAGVTDIRHAPQALSARSSISRRWMQGNFGWSNHTGPLLLHDGAPARDQWAQTVQDNGRLISVSTDLAEVGSTGEELLRRVVTNTRNNWPLPPIDIHVAAFGNQRPDASDAKFGLTP
jgi:alpha-galactosidase